MDNSKILEAGEEGSLVSFNWYIIDVCQYRCGYCSVTEFINKETFKEGLHQKSHELVLHKLKRFNFDFKIELLGGEPTLHPNMPYIIEELEKMEHCKVITIATNLTAGVPYFMQFDKPNTKVLVHMSYHTEYHKKILNKLIKLNTQFQHAKVFVEVILNPKKQYFQQLIDFMRDLKTNGIMFGINLVRKNEFWDGIVDEGFNETFAEWTKDPYLSPLTKLIKHVTTDGVEYMHETDIQQQELTYNGFNCQQLTYHIGITGDFTNVCTQMRLPMLAKEADFKKTITCPLDCPCPCSQMFHYKKTRK